MQKNKNKKSQGDSCLHLDSRDQSDALRFVKMSSAHIESVSLYSFRLSFPHHD